MFHFEAILSSSWVADFLYWESICAVQKTALLAEQLPFSSLPNENVIEGQYFTPTLSYSLQQPDGD